MSKKKQQLATGEASDQSPDEVLNRLASLNEKLTDLLKPLTEDLQELLDELEGKSFGFEANEPLTVAIQMLLQRLGLRVKCVKCSAPAHIRCRKMKGTRGGSFQFEHTKGKQTNHGGGTIFPKVQLVAAPPDSRRRRKKRR